MKKGYLYQTVIGDLWIAEEDGAITNISFQKPEETMEEEETLILQEANKQLTEYFTKTRKVFDLPINPTGTPFQRMAWDSLLKIPYGETRTYKQQAELAGNPKAIRAVGMANNQNPIMIVIPCHRVLGSDGSLTGYAAGLDIKRFLLNLEKTPETGLLFDI